LRVKILAVNSGNEIDALIREGKVKEMPSMQDGWRFNFNKQLKQLKDAKGYILLTNEGSLVVEGCMIFQLIDKKEPYLSMIEVAPHNRSAEKRYDWVAGCLIAYAFMQSVLQGQGVYNAFLQLDVLEQDPENERKLMSLYSRKYHAKRIGKTTTMVIADEDGERLKEKYLKITDQFKKAWKIKNEPQRS
jgi:hypothetical protein